MQLKENAAGGCSFAKKTGKISTSAKRARRSLCLDKIHETMNR